MFSSSRSIASITQWSLVDETNDEIPKRSSVARSAALVALGVSLLLGLKLCDSLYWQPQEYATCQDCFCIPDEPGQECPWKQAPPTDFDEFIPQLRSMTHTNPMTLDCDPYLDPEGCQTTPVPIALEGGACVVKPGAEDTYSLETFPGTLEQALERGLIITHAGPCGVCSSLQDLAAYMEQGAAFRVSATICGIRGRLDDADAATCFRELGLTDACANIWAFNTKHTYKQCRHLCLPFVLSGNPPNRFEEPQCPLEQCIECDERESGPLFQAFSRRTRRSSGLRSNIARPCSQISTTLQQKQQLERLFSQPVVLSASSAGETAACCAAPSHLLHSSSSANYTVMATPFSATSQW